MYWQLYDYYLMPNGAYYGAKKASQPLHLIYDYHQHAVYAVNDRLTDVKKQTVSINAYDIKSKQRYKKEMVVDFKANQSIKILDLPPFDWNRSVCFLDLSILNQKGKEVDHNFYWLSHKKDVLDYQTVVQPWNYYTPSKEYADFTALNQLPSTKLVTEVNQTTKGDKTIFQVNLKNTGKTLAFFLNVKIKDKKTGETILPVLWSDNDISIMPGKTRKLTATVETKLLKGKEPEVVTSWYNQ
jgi:exo-1,4-beta-D-glucosaminidase